MRAGRDLRQARSGSVDMPDQIRGELEQIAVLREHPGKGLAMIPVLPITGDVLIGTLARHRKGVAEYRFEMLHLCRVDAGTQTASRVLIPAGIGRLEQVSVLARQLLVKQYARKCAVT